MQKNPHLSFIPHKKLNAPWHHEMLPVDKNSECERNNQYSTILSLHHNKDGCETNNNARGTDNS